MSDVLTLEVVNWDKYNERADRKNYVWFRFENAFFFDQAIFGLSESAVVTFVFLLCEASKRGGGTFKLRMDYFSLFRKKKSEQITKDLEELGAANLIACFPQENAGDCQATAVNPQETAAYRQTDRQTDRHNNNAHSVRFDFEAIYNKYPRKLGKGKGLKACKAQVKTEADYQALSQAVDRYAAYCRKNATEPQYIKHFSSFMTVWRDWLEADTGKTALPTVATRPEHAVHRAADPAPSLPLVDKTKRFQGVFDAINKGESQDGAA